MMKFKPFLLATFAICLLATTARADRRNFAFTYEPKVLAPGETEIEYYMTAAIRRDKRLGDAAYAWSHQVELEYGIVDGVDVGMYQMFSATAWQGYKLRARYMPFAPGELPIDFLVYGEFIQKANGDWALEERVVLGKTFDKFIVAFDTVTEQSPLNDGAPNEIKLQHALALGYAVAPWLTLGVENQLRMAWERAEYTGDIRFQGTKYYVGPSISLAAKRGFWDASFGYRLQGKRDDAKYLFRILWGVFL